MEEAFATCPTCGDRVILEEFLNRDESDTMRRNFRSKSPSHDVRVLEQFEGSPTVFVSRCAQARG